MSSVCENLLAREIFQCDVGAIHPFGGEIVETHVDSGRAAECRRADEQARGGERGSSDSDEPERMQQWGYGSLSGNHPVRI